MRAVKMFKNFTLLIACIAFFACSLKAKEKKPNIVMLYIDDWAWCGSPVAMDDNVKNSFMPILEMPNMEKLADQGMKFRNAYGSPQCAPARVCVQTGQSAPRSGFTVVLGKISDEYYDNRPMYNFMPMLPNISDTEIDTLETTIAEALKPLGYASAHVGKWHMYSDPGKHGYEVHDGETDNTPGNTMKKGLEKGERYPPRLPEDMTDPKLMFSITEKAIGFMEDQVKKGNPFYLQISHYAMHSGSECLPSTRLKYTKHPLVQEYYKKTGQAEETINRRNDPAVWLGMGNDLDGRIGAVLDKLEELGIKENTYVVLVSDNGYRHHELELTPGYTQPLHGHKWWIWDGGIRVPMIVNGPGIAPGSVFEGNVVNYDFLPTFVDWAGGKVRKLKNIDGISLKAYMEGKKPNNDFLNRNIYFHYPHYRESMPTSAVVSGSYKLMHFYQEPDIPMLFDLSNDIGEVHNIAKENPEKHQALYNEMMEYLKDVGARFPKTNPNFDAEKYKNDIKAKERDLWGPFEGDRPLEADEK